MSIIHLTTFIAAPVNVVFDLSRNISFHEQSMKHANEKAIAGKTSGLIELGETVTWQARHLFKNRRLQTRITAIEPYTFFEDCLVKGDFSAMAHQHHFKETANGTLLIDVFNYSVPYSWFGNLFDKLYLHSYMTRLLKQRNKCIKQCAEGNTWQQFVQDNTVGVNRQAAGPQPA